MLKSKVISRYGQAHELNNSEEKTQQKIIPHPASHDVAHSRPPPRSPSTIYSINNTTVPCGKR